MAMNDWNGNGKKDLGDDFIEYEIYNDVTEDDVIEQSKTSSSHGGISTFGALVSTILGFVLQVMLYMVLGIDVANVPIIVILILWFVFFFIVACIVDKIGL